MHRRDLYVRFAKVERCLRLILPADARSGSTSPGRSDELEAGLGLSRRRQRALELLEERQVPDGALVVDAPRLAELDAGALGDVGDAGFLDGDGGVAGEHGPEPDVGREHRRRRLGEFFLARAPDPSGPVAGALGMASGPQT